MATRIILAYHLLVFSHHANLYCRGPSVRVVLGALTYFDAFTIFVALFGLGFHRYFIIEDYGILRIVSFNIFKPRKVQISDIEKVEVIKTGLCLIFKNGKKRQFYMRKWPKKYFLDALALHPNFKGEVELMDHMTNFDYFAFYEEPKKALKIKLRK